MLTFNCPYCGKSVTKKTGNTITCCNDPECIKKHNADLHQKRKPIAICARCGKKFKQSNGTQYCHECTMILRKPKYKTYIQNITCKHCGKVLYQVTKNVTKKVIYDNPIGVCEECKKLNNIAASTRLTINNPSIGFRTDEQIQEAHLKKAEDKKYKIEHVDELKEIQHRKRSEYMKKNNPMKNPEIVAKNAVTRIHNAINNPRKTTHYINLKETVRTYLYEWKERELKRANYKCEICGATDTQLQVHHCKIKYKDIFAYCCRELGIKYHSLTLESPEYKALIKKVQEYHLTHDGLGLVVCPNCHANIDKFYRVK